MESTNRVEASFLLRLYMNLWHVAAVFGLAGIALLGLLLMGARDVGANEGDGGHQLNVSGDELVTNGGFENFARDGWSQLACPGECDPAAAIDHDLFVGLIGRPFREDGFMEASTTLPGSSVIQVMDAAPQPGDFYQGKIWVRSPFDGLVDIEIALTAMGETSLETGSTRSLVSDVWTPIDVVLAVDDAGHDSLQVELIMHTNNVHYNFDEVSVVGSLTEPTVNGADPYGQAGTVSTPSPGTVQVIGWAVDPSHSERRIATRTTIGGALGDEGVEVFENGLTTKFRGDLAISRPWIKTGHGFDVTLETDKIGRQQVCTYAINIDQGQDRLLACKNITISSSSVMCGGLPATIVGTPGDDVLRGTAGPDVIAGLQGNDTISGLRGDDIICGGIGDDTIYGNGGFDILYGAQGNDVLIAANGERAGALTDTAGSRMFGGAGDDMIYGSTRWDRMQGGNGNDQMWGFAGNDWMRGGRGADTLDGGLGSDNAGGGAQWDTIVVAGRANTVHGNLGVDTCTVGAAPASVRSCERLR